MRYFLSIAIALSMLSAAVRTTHVFASEHAVAPIPATNECDYYRTKRTAVLALEEAYDDAALPCSAAMLSQAYAVTSSSGTPSPLAYMRPRMDCAVALPCSA